MDRRPDKIDRAVYSETFKVRRMYLEACERLGLTPTVLTPVTLMQRSVPDA